jgi:hypothetical protein
LANKNTIVVSEHVVHGCGENGDAGHNNPVEFQGTFMEHSGNIQRTFREHSGNIRGTFKEIQDTTCCMAVEKTAMPATITPGTLKPTSLTVLHPKHAHLRPQNTLVVSRTCHN